MGIESYHPSVDSKGGKSAGYSDNDWTGGPYAAGTMEGYGGRQFYLPPSSRPYNVNDFNFNWNQLHNKVLNKEFPYNRVGIEYPAFHMGNVPTGDFMPLKSPEGQEVRAGVRRIFIETQTIQVDLDVNNVHNIEIDPDFNPSRVLSYNLTVFVANNDMSEIIIPAHPVGTRYFEAVADGTRTFESNYVLSQGKVIVKSSYARQNVRVCLWGFLDYIPSEYNAYSSL